MLRKKEQRVEVVLQDFREALPQILARVADVSNLDSWKEAFPKVEFMEVDEGLTGQPIDWNKRSPIEKAAYVAYMTNPDKVKINYEVSIDGYKIRLQIDDCERAWYLWFHGCFDFFDEGKKGEIPYEARSSLLFYAAQQAGEFEELIRDNYDPDYVVVNSFEMRAVQV